MPQINNTDASSQDHWLKKLLKSYRFSLYIGVIFMLLVLGIQVSTLLFSRTQVNKIVLDSANSIFGEFANTSRLELKLLEDPLEVAVQLLAPINDLAQASNFKKRMDYLGIFTSALSSSTEMASIYIGYSSGDFFLVRPIRGEQQQTHYQVPETTAFLIQSIEQGGKIKRWIAIDANLQILSERSPTDYIYDPRKRPWYQSAMETDTLIHTPPYIFSTTKTMGRTFAMRANGGNAVVGADLEMSELSQMLSQKVITPSAQLTIFNDEDGVIAFSDPKKLILKEGENKFTRSTLGQLSPSMAAVAANPDQFKDMQIVNIANEDWVIQTVKLQKSSGGDLLAIASPFNELMANANANERKLVAISILIILLSLPLIWWCARIIAGQLNNLSKQVLAVQRFDFKSEFVESSRVSEILELGQAIDQMKGTIQKFLEVSIALTSERNFNALIDRVLLEVCEAAGSDGGIIYLFDEDANQLRYVSQHWLDHGTLTSDIQPDLSFDDVSNLVIMAVKHSKEATLLRVDAPCPQGISYIEERYGIASVEMLVIPLLGRSGSLVGVICACIAPGELSPSIERMAMVKAFSGAAAVSIDQQRLLESQKNLLTAFIGLVAGAIDAKSPYTGGHCQRVPEITEMLTRAAHDSDDAPFAEFELNNEEWEELRIASWLHDCGKVTTPEYVVDKATKLETIYDRIHEIRMRFEVLKRDAEITTLKTILAGGDTATLQEQLKNELKLIDEDFDFIAQCNIGGEFMSPEKVERLQKIAARTWLRTLDNRIGLSQEELRRIERDIAMPLPAQENLLADKLEHIIEREAKDHMAADNPWGFKLSVPEHLYNRGELHNLSIAKGTLTEEERYKVNDHIVQTIIMLSKLPFPGHLKNIVSLAGGHHEKMDGTGYPRRIKRDEMSIPARIMAIADIFEALTATDRPYKKGKTLSESIKIMGFMAKDGHIDLDLFKLFLQSKVYLTFAKKHLQAELIDEVDISQYL